MRNVQGTYLQHIKHNVSLIDIIISKIAPHDCLGCHAEGKLLCNICLKQLPSIEPKRLESTYISLVKSLTSYEGVAKALIWKLKSSGAQEAARIMAKSMVELLPKNKNFIITPIPTASTRVRQRGYDHARLLAREISRQSRLPYSNCLLRQGQAHQVGAAREQRLLQLSTAFRLKRPSSIHNKHILLVDDVVTTGATLETAAKILIQAGAKHVSAITFAQPKLRIQI